MSFPDEGPCQPWCTWAQVTACVPYDLSSITDEDQQTDLIDQGSGILFNLNHRRYPGECESTRTVTDRVVWSWWSYISGDRCRPGEVVDLGSEWAVSSITSVTVNGVILDPSAYRVDGWRYLRRIDGLLWPRAVDLADLDAFSIVYKWGRPVPKAGQRAAARFVAELAAECIDGEDCQIPQHVTSVTREGMTFVVIDSFKMLEEGRTGIYSVDAFLRSDEEGSIAPAGGVDPAAPSVSMALGTGGS